MQGRHGHLIVPTNPHPAHVGYAVAQTVFRLRDRQVLSVFFTERLRGSLDGFDPLRRLQRWSGRGQLTGHALRLVEDPKFEDRVRAAIRVAFQSWDGAELVETRRWRCRAALAGQHPPARLPAAPPRVRRRQPEARRIDDRRRGEGARTGTGGLLALGSALARCRAPRRSR